MGRGDAAKATALNTANAATGTALTSQGAQGITTAIRDFRDQINDKIFNNNPYTDPTYLANVRSAASSVESGAQNAGNTKIEDYAQRTGENSGNVMAQEEEGARESARRQHQVLTANAIDNQDKRQQQLMSGVAMLGQVPGMYSPIMGSGTSLATGGASGETQLAGQPSWFDSLINAGVGAAGTAAAGFCPVEGSLIEMYDGTKMPIESLSIGDVIKGADGGPEKILSKPEPHTEECFEVTCGGGAWARVSASHTFAGMPGYVVAKESLSRTVLTSTGPATVVGLIPLGKQTVYRLRLDRTHTYLSEGIWSLE